MAVSFDVVNPEKRPQMPSFRSIHSSPAVSRAVGEQDEAKLTWRAWAHG